MKIKCLIAAMFIALLCTGCSNKDESQKQKNTENEVPLEGGGNVDEPMPREPKYQTKGCLRSCRGLPCDEAARCVKRNCPNVRIECENGEYEVFEEKSFNVKPHKKILCQKGCDDVPENSVEYENCVLRNCPDAKFVISNKDFDPEDSIMVGVRAFRAAKKEFVKRWNYAKDTKRREKQRHSEIQEKFNKHAECVKSQNVDILKDSVRFKAVFDSCWQECMIEY